MKNRTLILAVAMLCLTVFGTLAPAARADEVYFVAADEAGNSNYMGLTEDGTLTDPMLITSTGWITYGSAMGDFDNDGDFDYIAASGFFFGSLQLSKKVGDGNQFDAPVQISTWSNAYYTGKIVVADFNADNHLDFVVTYLYRDDAELFLGDGQLNFGQPISLPFTTPYDSVAADTADFDKDGSADFVSASFDSSTQIYVNFGDISGVFVTNIIETHGSNQYSGIAAADFNGDGFADLAAARTGAIDVYLNDGQRNFSFDHSVVDPKIWDSPLDNYDVNGDGKQDLILGSYGESTTNMGDTVAVLLGNGTGDFTESGIYDSGDRVIRVAIAAPAPPKELSNEDPVAVIEPSELNVESGQAAEFTAVASYDPDGEIVSYTWDFGDGDQAEDLAVGNAASKANGIAASHVFDEAGDYTVTLTVTDDRETTNSITATVHVTAPIAAPKIEARVIFSPKTLNLNSNRKWVKAYLRLPQEYDERQIDLDSLYLVDPESGQQIAAASLGRYKRWWRVYRVKFDRQALISHIGEPESHVSTVDLQIQGKVLHNDGMVDLEATGKIKAYKPKPKRNHWRKFCEKFWKR